MLDVIEVVAQLLHFLVKAVGVLVAHLCPACDAGTDGRAQRVIRYLLAALRGVARYQDEEFAVADRMWARTHEVHVPAKHVDELRQLVEAKFPEPAADARDPRRVVRLPLAVGARLLAHAAEL